MAERHVEGYPDAAASPPPCPAGCGCRWLDDADLYDCGCVGGCCDEEWDLLPDGRPRPDGYVTGAFVTVHGRPVPQGSKTAFVRAGRAVLTDGRRPGARAAHAAWRDQVRNAAADWLAEHGGRRPWDDAAPLVVELVFALPKPSGARKRDVWAAKRPDLDKLARCVLDGLADGALLADDARVVLLTCAKVYAASAEATCCAVSVWPATDVHPDQVGQATGMALGRAQRAAEACGGSA